MKQKYQRNLLCGIGSVVVLSLLVTGGITLYDAHNQQMTATIEPADVDRSVHILRMMEDWPKPVERHVTAPNPEGPKNMEWFNDVRTTPDAQEPPPFDTSLVYSDTATFGDGSVQSFSDLVCDTGVGIYPSAPEPSLVVEPVIVPCSVLVAVSPEYPWVARERSKEGAAGIIVCIDESGKVTLFPGDVADAFRARNLSVEMMSIKVDGQRRQFNYVVTYEEPSGWFFAKKVAEVLPTWVFEPSTIDGQVVKSLIPIGHAFCMTEDCRFEKELLNYKQFHRPTQ